MDLSGFFGAIWDSALAKIVPFLFVLTIIVFFHELGHYLVGRLSGIRVLAFSVGFGKELLGFTDRHGTRWKLSAIPLGGYVKFLGDENAASIPDNDALGRMSEAERRGAFATASVGRRAATIAAGPIANFILAIAIFTGVTYFNGRVVADPVVAEVVAGSPAESAGVSPGDRIVSADGQAITYFNDFQRLVAARANTPINVIVERNGQQVPLVVTPEERVQTDQFGNEYTMPLVGIQVTDASSSFRVEHYSMLESLGYGVSQTWFITATTVDFIGGLFTGSQPADQIGGPIRIAQMSSQAASIGFATLLNMAALLSISIGLLNLLPIPVLDGGHLLYCAFEVIRGKPLSEKTQEIGFRIGLVLVMGLMVFAFSNDLL